MERNRTSSTPVTYLEPETLSVLMAAPQHLRQRTPFLLALWDDLISHLRLSNEGATLTALKAYNIIHPQTDKVKAISALASE